MTPFSEVPASPGPDASNRKPKKKLGIILYTMPTTEHFRFGLELGKAALDRGYSVQMFAWGDSVYALSSEKNMGEFSRITNELSLLLKRSEDGFVLDVCTSCYKLRGLPESGLIPGAHLSGLHKIVEMIRTADKTVAMIP